jgi:hypothetical protein
MQRALECDGTAEDGVPFTGRVGGYRTSVLRRNCTEESILFFYSNEAAALLNVARFIVGPGKSFFGIVVFFSITADFQHQECVNTDRS